ncbi:MAG: hypothetical protein IM535_08360 [Pseudanabaena sp. M38BS1SP1A06MG]|nr:hypothetical protein [Pseudanabaena sp. M53BS1SP1A06MG]MCA6592117.1 hypothetical protein [Pseudanabaena sp. M38BS1SP1A06MG]
MQISLLLRRSAEKFNQASELVCVEWSMAIGSSGICSPRDRLLFENLVKTKLIAQSCEEKAIVHTITGDNHVQSKLSA